MKSVRKWFGIRPSTIAFYREARGRKDFSWRELVHGYVYGRWPYLYIGVATGRHRRFKQLELLAEVALRWWAWRSAGRARRALPDPGAAPATAGAARAKLRFADTYHGKVLLPDAARRLVTVGRDIRLTGLETVVPYELARDVILKHPDHIVLLDCPCRSSRPDPCLPLDVCLVIGEPFAGFIAEHHPTKSRWISRDEALDVLKAAGERGDVHHAFFKEAMLGRFYAICNCCACCCGAMQARRNGVPMLAPSGYLARVDPQRCAGCGTCAAACPFEAAALAAGTACVYPARCMGCGVCAPRCPSGAIVLDRAAHTGDPLDLNFLLPRPADTPQRTDEVSTR
jgi:NAD-dependent dihydropyrimidine dehydrogenase PreA subunit